MTEVIARYARPRLALLRLRPSTATVHPRMAHALAVLLLLTQLPHVVHLPIWVTVVGVGLIAARLRIIHHPDERWLDGLLSSLTLTIACALIAVIIRWQYGYFVGRDPAVAFLFILVAAKFAELRRDSDATLLMCLSGFLLLTQYFYSQTVIAALVTLPAVFALGHALAVVRDPGHAAPARHNLPLVGKMLLQGAPLALLLFVVFPRVSGPLWSIPEDSMSRTGLSDSMQPGAIADLSRSPEVAFRVEFDGEPPPRHLRYWRGPVFDQFDGRTWRASPIRQAANLSIDGDSDVLAYTVMLQPHHQNWMFALDQAASLPLRSGANPATTTRIASIMTTGELVSHKPINRITRYRQRSTLSTTLNTTVPPQPWTLDTHGQNPKAIRLGQELALQHRTAREIAQAMMQRFSEAPFRYTLRPPLLGHRAVDEFLFETHAGFCEHYASAFAVVMRAAGIPARVVTGYLGGEMNGDYMIVRQSDAHAWTELYIDGAWHRFDPTAAIAPSRIEDGVGSALDDDEPLPQLARLNGSWFGAAQLRWDRFNHAWQRFVVDFDDDAQGRLWERLGLNTPALWQMTLAILVATGLWIGLLLGLPRFGHWREQWRARWRGEPLPPAERAWQRLQKILSRHGFERDSAETPTTWLQRVAREKPGLADALRALDAGFAHARFARVIEDAEISRLNRDIKLLANALERA